MTAKLQSLHHRGLARVASVRGDGERGAVTLEFVAVLVILAGIAAAVMAGVQAANPQAAATTAAGNLLKAVTGG